ncbi:hypothetical protein LR48_Vigan10g168600 [Vigna angularis]|uniref:Uncharacterized protein n=1 Tax=Phaseolus angularis TaxID=3914 RepID=A0A0L9VM21_PHAAN|nr:hypothetical protein LR48_Vigan10g168600 [Vigna angularis]
MGEGVNESWVRSGRAHKHRKVVVMEKSRAWVHHDVDVGASMKDKKDDQPRPKMKDDQPTPKKLQKRKRRENFMRALDEQENLIAELKRRVVVLEAELVEEKARRRNEDDGGQSVPREELSMNIGFFFPGGMSTNQPSMKTYVRMGSRRRYKSRELRTPYIGFVRIKYE